MPLCPQCGVASPDQARFCRNCGYTFLPLASGPTIPAFPVPSPRSNPSPFIPNPNDRARVSYSPPQNFLPPLPIPPLPSVSPPPAKRKGRKSVFIGISVISLLLLSVAGLFVFFTSKSLPHLSITQGQPKPGQSITLLGEHFPAGNTISVVLDSQPLQLSLHEKNLLFLTTSLVPLSFSEPQGVIYRTVVGGDGTFTLKIRIPSILKAGSKLTLIAQVTGANPHQLKPIEYRISVAS